MIKPLGAGDLCKLLTHGVGAITADSKAQSVNPHLYVILANIRCVMRGNIIAITLPFVH